MRREGVRASPCLVLQQRVVPTQPGGYGVFNCPSLKRATASRTVAIRRFTGVEASQSVCLSHLDTPYDGAHCKHASHRSPSDQFTHSESNAQVVIPVPKSPHPHSRQLQYMQRDLSSRAVNLGRTALTRRKLISYYHHFKHRQQQ